MPHSEVFCYNSLLENNLLMPRRNSIMKWLLAVSGFSVLCRCLPLPDGPVETERLDTQRSG